MKTCPTCHRNYENEMKFCLDDGSPLVAESGMTTASSTDATLHLPGHSTEQPPNVLSSRQASPLQSTMAAGGIKPPSSAPPAGASVHYASKARSGTALLWVVAALIIGAAAIVVALIVTRGINRNENSATNSAMVTASPSEATANRESSSSDSEAKPASLAETAPSNQATKKKEPATPIPTPRKAVATVIGSSTSPEANTTPPPTGPRTLSAPISGGVLNGKAVYLAKPAYPPIAKTAHASGSVTVRVLIDENGNVVSATAVSGHPLLQASAVSAARASKFTPTKLSGQPVKVSGVIVYNFVAQ